MRPVLFRLGPLAFYAYGSMLALGLLIGLYVAAREGKRRGVDPGAVVDFGIYAFLAGLVLSRAIYVLMHLQEYLAAPVRILHIHEGGLALHGGVAGGIVVGLVYARRRGIPFWRLADIAAPSLALGTALARVGCFLNGCCYGRLTDVPWAVLTRYAPGLRHPAQLYEGILVGLLFLVLWGFRLRARREGDVFLLYVALYSAIRFGVEFTREVEMLTPYLSVTQAVSLLLIVLAAALGVLRRRAVSG